MLLFFGGVTHQLPNAVEDNTGTILAIYTPGVHAGLEVSVMIGSPGDREALEAGRLGLSHWAGPSVTGSTREVSNLEWGYHG